MPKHLDFESVADLVLSGACAVETVADVPPFPAQGAPQGSALVVMHRRVAGAVCLYGSFRNRMFLVGCFSNRLRSVVLERFPKDFELGSHRGPLGSVRFLFDAVVEASRSDDATAFDDFLFVAGAEGAELISELRRLQRLAAGSPDGVLH